ncbi:hypothetical protein UAM5_00004 [Ralstonia phage UAM5]|nr:hypothetical protein UAM5_00004 [Ralstonia phage UAM5]
MPNARLRPWMPDYCIGIGMVWQPKPSRPEYFAVGAARWLLCRLIATSKGNTTCA